MPISNFKTLFYNVITAHYRDWKTDVKQVTWDRKADKSTLKWDIKNTKKQQVIVGLSSAQARQFKDRSCWTKEKVDTVFFSLYNSSGSYVAAQGNTRYSYLTSTSGQAWLVFEDLPEGDYQLRVI